MPKRLLDDAPASVLPESGMTLDGRYELVRELGAGGMGMVFEGVHLRLRRPVAIKILRPEFAVKREFQIRFEREARASTLIQSPHAVRVFDVATSREGLTYMVMELLSGSDLGEVCEEGPLKLCDLADWIIQACAALQEAHQHKIIHRDLKPANIFIAKHEDGSRIAKLLDFGISKFDDHLTAALTKPVDGTLGTPTFMSPEQIRGRKLDPRTDIWALGVILYRVLGHRWPFQGVNDRAYMAAVLADPPIPFELVRGDLPYEFANVVMRALEKKPDDRFASASELAAALKPFGSGRAPLVEAGSGATPAMAAVSLSTSTGVPDTEREPTGGSTARIRPPGGVPDDDPRWIAARTVPATPREAMGLTPPALAIETSNPPRPGRAIWIAVAAGFTCVLGFAGYIYVTKAPTAPTPAATAQVSADPPSAPSSADPISSLSSPPPPATGVAATASASARPVRPGTRPHPSAKPTSSSAPPASSSAPLPDYL